MAKRVSFKTPSRLTTVLLGRRHYPQICKLLTLCFSHLAGRLMHVIVFGLGCLKAETAVASRVRGAITRTNSPNPTP